MSYRLADAGHVELFLGRGGRQGAQMLSGGISVFAGAGFLFQGHQGSAMIAGAAGYAAIGAVFFLVSAIRLSMTLKKEIA